MPRALAVATGVSGRTSRARQWAGGGMRDDGQLLGIGGNGQAAMPAGRHIVGVAFEPHGLVDDLRRVPIEAPESRGQGDRGQPHRRRGTAAHTHRNAVAHADVERHDRALLGGQHRLVGLQSAGFCSVRRRYCGLRPVAVMENCGSRRRPRSPGRAPGPAPWRQSPGPGWPKWREAAGAPSSCLNSRLEHTKHGIGRGLERERGPALLGDFPLQPGGLLRASTAFPDENRWCTQNLSACGR